MTRSLAVLVTGLWLLPQGAAAQPTPELERVITTPAGTTHTLAITEGEALVVSADKNGVITKGPHYAPLTRAERRQIWFARVTALSKANPLATESTVTLQHQGGERVDIRGKVGLNAALDQIEAATRKRSTPAFNTICLRLAPKSDSEPRRVLTIDHTGKFRIDRTQPGAYLPLIVGQASEAELNGLALDVIRSRLGDVGKLSSQRLSLEISGPHAALRTEGNGTARLADHGRATSLLSRLTLIVRAAETRQPKGVYVGTVINDQGEIALKGDETVRLRPTSEQWRKNLARFRNHEVTVKGTLAHRVSGPHGLEIKKQLYPVPVEVEATAAGNHAIRIHTIQHERDDDRELTTPPGAVTVYGPLAPALKKSSGKSHVTATIYLHADGKTAYLHSVLAVPPEDTQAGPLGRGKGPTLDWGEPVRIIGFRGDKAVIETDDREWGLVPLDRLQIGRPAADTARGAAATLNGALD